MDQGTPYTSNHFGQRNLSADYVDCARSCPACLSADEFTDQAVHVSGPVSSPRIGITKLMCADPSTTSIKLCGPLGIFPKLQLKPVQKMRTPVSAISSDWRFFILEEMERQPRML
ncbi:hypothetical protein RRF57_004621 [Xylaria bambusicola]|uniref:Uncharacterized protein n=1 Tax=Xylaria bambusicola TaxID=326684 RepID=A0AAN7UM48_9PEZI